MIKKSSELIVFLLVILLLPLGEAIGISGTQLTITEFFVPGETFTYTFYAMPMKENQELTFLAEGVFEDYVTFSPEKITGNDGDYVPFQATIKLPSEAEPGRLSTKICVIEDPSGGSISIRTKACAIVRFMSLYDGKYINMAFSAPNANVNETVPFTVSIDNFGKEDISEIRGEIEVFEGETTIAKLNTNTVSLNSKESTVLIANWDSTGIKAGEYSAKATVYYDGEKKEAYDDFLLGKLNVLIEDYTKKVELGKINEFQITVKSGWNLDISSIYGEVRLLDDNKEIVSFKTPSESLKSWETKTFLGYLDGNKVKSTGKYDAEIRLHYLNQMTSVMGEIEVVDSLTEEKPKAEFNMLLLIAVIAVVVMFIFLIIRRKSKNEA